MTPTADTRSTRLTAADWVAWARECKAVGRDDLILTCLNHAAALASEEGGRTLAEILEGSEPTWMP